MSECAEKERDRETDDSRGREHVIKMDRSETNANKAPGDD